MQEIKEQRLTGERALFRSKDLSIEYSIFADGESPLKESRDISLKNTSFQWKYPLWYCRNITVQDCDFAETARAGIWYTDNITVADTLYEAPKGFRRVKGLTLRNVDLPHAEETLWHCSDVTLENVVAKGDYFAMNCGHMKLDQFRLVGNYCFDGCHDVEVHHAKMLSKDAFWNCENVMVYDSFVSGEYFGWNAKNVTLINCTIESEQGFCYMENLVMKDCKLLNTNLAFEYSTVDAEINSNIDSVKNPIRGKIVADHIDEIIFDNPDVKKENTDIVTED